MKEFCPDLTVKAVPAFKNLYLWDEHEPKFNSSILVAFPISHTSLDILNSLIKAIAISRDDIEFILKPHPTVEPNLCCLL